MTTAAASSTNCPTSNEVSLWSTVVHQAPPPTTSNYGLSLQLDVASTNTFTCITMCPKRIPNRNQIIHCGWWWKRQGLSLHASPPAPIGIFWSGHLDFYQEFFLGHHCWTMALVPCEHSSFPYCVLSVLSWNKWSIKSTIHHKDIIDCSFIEAQKIREWGTKSRREVKDSDGHLNSVLCYDSLLNPGGQTQICKNQLN